MIQQDTTQLVHDSLSTAQADSLATIDSLARVDSLHIADSIKLALSKPTGFLGSLHPSLPISENWVFLALIFFFVLLVISIISNPIWIKESVRTFFQVKDRSSFYLKNSSSQFQTRTLLLIFNAGVFSLYSFLLFFNPKSGFYLTKYLLFYGITILFLIIKDGVGQIIGYVFLDKISLKLARESYFNVLSYLGITLFPTLMLQIYLPDNINFMLLQLHSFCV